MGEGREYSAMRKKPLDEDKLVEVVAKFFPHLSTEEAKKCFDQVKDILTSECLESLPTPQELKDKGF